MRYRYRTHQILEVAGEGDRASRIADIFILSLIGLNVLAIILESVAALEQRYAVVFTIFERFSVAAFTIEYALRLWSCVEDPRFRRAVRGRLSFAVTPLAVLDLLAILPFYLRVFPIDLRFLRTLRLLRLFRILKVARYSKALRVIGNVVREKKAELCTTIFVLSLLLILASCLLYYVEHGAQPDVFSSIPATMWWAVATFTTVGYGDIYPVTGLGKLIAALMAILGIGVAALPTGIIASGFVEQHEVEGRVCPHCGKRLE